MVKLKTQRQQQHGSAGVGTMALLAALAIPGALTGQTEDEPVFGERVEVRVINVEVVVTDRSGNRVQGLTADDFELLVDGEPVPVEYFSEISDDLEPAMAGEVVPSDGEAPFSEPRLRAPQAPETSRSQITNVLIVVDDVFSIHTQRLLVLENLIRQLSSLGPQDRVAVLSYDGRRLHVRTPWTSSMKSVEAALEATAAYPSRGLYPKFRPLDEFAEVMLAAGSALRLAGSPDGRKILLLVAGAWPQAPPEEDPLAVAEASSELDPEGAFSDFQRLWRSRRASAYLPLIDTANGLGYTVYPVTTAGLPPSGPDVEAEAPSGSAGPPSQLSDGAIGHLARETGGRILWAKDRFEALERALDDGRAYYLLGFTNHTGESARHAIKVRLANGSLRTRFRRSFVDFDQRMAANSFVEAGLIADNVQSPGQHQLGLEVLNSNSLRRISEIELEIAVPAARLTFLTEQDEQERARVELSFGVIDESGALSDITALPLSFERPANGPGFVTYRQTITIRSEPHDFVAVVRDLASEEILTGEIRIDPLPSGR